MYACCCHCYTLSMRTDVAAQDLFSLHKICSVCLLLLQSWNLVCKIVCS